MKRFSYLRISIVSVAAGLACRFTKDMDISHSLLVAGSVFIVGFIVRCIWLIFLYPIYFSPLIGLPEPNEKNHWLMGQYPRIRYGTCGSQLRKWAHTVQNNGMIRYRTFFNGERVLLLSPTSLREVLVTQAYNFTKSPEFSWVIKPTFGNSVIVAEGNPHKYQRKHLAPAFSFRQVQNMIPIMWTECLDAVNHLTGTVCRGYAAKASTLSVTSSEKITEPWIEIDMMNFLSRTALNVISFAGMGLPMNAVKDPHNELHIKYSILNTPSRADQYINVATTVMGPWVKSLPFERNRIAHLSGIYVRNVCRQIVHDKKTRIACGDDKSYDMVSIILQKGMFSDDKIIDQMMTFFLAGHETTATAVQWIVWVLAVYPKVAEKLRREIRDNIPSPNSEEPFDPTIISNLYYLQAVIHETLRLIPPVPWLERYAIVDTIIDGVMIPKGTRLSMAPWAINGNPAVWGNDVNLFRPERWFTYNEQGEIDRWDAAGGAGTPYANGAFLHGPRGCLGMAFAKGEMGCIVALLSGRFKFEMVDKRDEDLGFLEYTEMGRFFSRVGKGLHMKVSVVEGW